MGIKVTSLTKTKEVAVFRISAGFEETAKWIKIKKSFGVIKSEGGKSLRNQQTKTDWGKWKTC